LKDLLEHTDKNLKPDDEIPSLEMKCGMFFLFIILCTANPGVNTCEERQVLVAFASLRNAMTKRSSSAGDMS
jgi:hypothetical protein